MKENKLEIQKINENNQMLHLNGQDIERVLEYSISKNTKGMAVVSLKFECEQVNIKNYENVQV